MYDKVKKTMIKGNKKPITKGIMSWQFWLSFIPYPPKSLLNLKKLIDKLKKVCYNNYIR